MQQMYHTKLIDIGEPFGVVGQLVNFAKQIQHFHFKERTNEQDDEKIGDGVD